MKQNESSRRKCHRSSDRVVGSFGGIAQSRIIGCQIASPRLVQFEAVLWDKRADRQVDNGYHGAKNGDTSLLVVETAYRCCNQPCAKLGRHDIKLIRRSETKIQPLFCQSSPLPLGSTSTTPTKRPAHPLRDACDYCIVYLGAFLSDVKCASEKGETRVSVDDPLLCCTRIG